MSRATIKLCLFALSGIIVWTMAACGDTGVVVTTPTGGGKLHNYSDCLYGPTVPSDWSNHDAKIFRVQPQCPVTAPEKTSFIEFVLDVSIGSAWVNYTTTPIAKQTTWNVFNLMNQISTAQKFLAYDTDSARWVAQLDSQGVPGQYTDPNDPSLFFDTTAVVLQQTAVSHDLEAFAKWPGRITNSPGTVLGNSAVYPNYGYSWRIQPEWDTSAYRFQWYVDGIPSAKDTGAIFITAFGDFGTHTLRADQILGDNSVLSSSATVNVMMEVGIVGPGGAINPYQNYDWTASIPFGYAPYTYHWSIDGMMPEQRRGLARASRLRRPMTFR